MLGGAKWSVLALVLAARPVQPAPAGRPGRRCGSNRSRWGRSQRKLHVQHRQRALRRWRRAPSTFDRPDWSDQRATWTGGGEAPHAPTERRRCLRAALPARRSAKLPTIFVIYRSTELDEQLTPSDCRVSARSRRQNMVFIAQQKSAELEPEHTTRSV